MSEMREPAEEVLASAGDTPAEAPNLLPFAFAKRFGVVITHSDDVLEDAADSLLRGVFGSDEDPQ